MKSLLSLVVLSLFICLNLFSQTREDIPGTDIEGLIALSEKLRVEHEINLAKAIKVAKEQGRPIRTEDEDGRIIELQGITEDGHLLYYSTENLVAAQTVSTDKVWPSGGFGYTLTGDSMTIGEWDGGGVLTSHQEFGGRVTQQDNPASTSWHATHVAGTMIASGAYAPAKGMSYEANLDAYEWTNDASEMAAAAANGLLISNHSYGFLTGWTYRNSQYEWWGNVNLSQQEDYSFGYYDANAQSWDQIAALAPYYLICKSAGNDRGETGSPNHYLPRHGTTVTNTPRPADGGTLGYDCIGTVGTAKNILTVGAVDDISNGYSIPSDVVMSSFSGWGPTDDGRIKPDICANGIGLTSSHSASNSSYASSNGTSMSTPSAAGSILLIQQHYKKVNGSYGKAATIKGLILHTADEAGSNPGPDYSFGWGLLNTLKAVQHISNDSSDKEIIETVLNDGQTFELKVISDGLSPIRATISWTDVPGTPVAATLDPVNLMLVNDLDLRVIHNDSAIAYQPYILNPASPASAATSGDNFRDNVEQVYIALPYPGSYTIQVSHKGSISGSSQNFSLITTGLRPENDTISCTQIIGTFPYVQNFESFNTCNNLPSSPCLLPINSGWENATTDSIDWTVFIGSTPTSSTGPISGYNANPANTKYAYIESSGSGFPSKQAILKSPCFDLSQVSNPELSFSYHMQGIDIGSLSCEVNDGLQWKTIWQKNGGQGATWLREYLDLSSYVNDTIQLRFIGITGIGELSDIGLDEIKIESNPLTCIETIDNFPYEEDFESFTTCNTNPGIACSLPMASGWINDIGDDIDWVVDIGGTPSNNTGPSADYNPGNSTGKYLYVEASTSGTGFPNMQAILNSPCYDLAGLNNTHVSFAYHMFGSTMGTLFVEVNTGSTWSQIWTLNSDQGNQWDTAQIDLSAYDGKRIKIRFRGITGSNFLSDMAIDNIRIYEVAESQFISSQSGNWNVGSTWVGGLAPSKQYHDVLIKSGHNVSLTGDRVVHDLSIENTGILSLANNQLSIYGDVAIDGNTDQTGLLEFIGNDAQSFIGSNNTFNSFHINNANGLSILGGSHSLKTSLKISNGIFNTNDSLTLLSDSLGTAYVDEITGGGIMGDVVVQRYLNESSSAFWYMLGSPVNNTSLVDWKNEIPMSGFPGTGSSWGPTVYRYDVSSIPVNGDYSLGYTAPTNITNSIDPGQGWLVWIAASPQTIDVKGPINSGTELVPVPYNTNPTGGETKRGWALLANPYPSPVLWSNVGKTNLESPEAFVSKPDGNYWALISDGVDTLFSAEAFWTQANVGGGSLTFEESDKVGGMDSYNMRLSQNPQFKFPLKMNLSFSGKTGYMDYAVLRYGSDTSTIHFDRTWGEAMKVANSFGNLPNIASHSVNEKAHIYYNTLSPLDSNWIIPISVWKSYPQNKNEIYTIEFNGIEEWNRNNHCLILHDSLNNLHFKLDAFNKTHSWTARDTFSNPYLFLDHSIPLKLEIENSTCYGYADGRAFVQSAISGSHDYTWYDENNNVIQTDVSSAIGSFKNNLEAGKYFVEVSGNGQCGTMGVVFDIVDGEEMVVAGFDVSTDTIRLNSPQQIEFNNTSSNALDYFWDFGDGNTSVLENPTHTYSSEGVYKVKLISGNGFCRDSLEKTISVLNNVSIHDANRDGEKEVNIYQYQGKAFIRFNFDVETEVQISMNDVLGREIITAFNLDVVKKSIYELNVPKNTKGINFVKVNFGEKVVIQKLLFEVH